MLFVPRQVALASQPAATAAMSKEEPKKEKKSKSKSAKANKGSDTRAVVVASVAAFLESSGFPRTLSALQSEANLEGDAWRSSPVNLEDLFSKFLESSNSAPGASITVSNEQDKTTEGVAEEEDAGKKKKKKKGGAEIREPESKASEPSSPEKPSENVDGETNEKKHKKDNSALGNDGGGEANATVKSDDRKLDGKKKKSKKHEKDEEVEARLEKVELAIKKQFEAAEKPKEHGKKLREEEHKSQSDDADKNGLGDGAPLDKGKKKKKGKSTSETSGMVDAGTAPAKVEGRSNGAKESSDAEEKGKDDNKKNKKMRKKSGSEENVLVEDKQVAEKDSVPKSDDVNKSGMDIDKCEDGKPSTDNAVVGKKRKLKEVEGSKPLAKEDSTANQKVNNGFAEDDTMEHSTISKPSKRQKHSAEPKTLNAFQRVKLEEVKFAHERLQDNSYWAKGGADSGYGAKAQEILGQVRGRGFRHEKTKKKRGTYRGGQIDLQTHSIKFNNSDDE